MRRSDREITEPSEIIKIMEKCDVCRIALNDADFPYILPLNFGMRVFNGRVELYFHGADEGTKYRLIERDNRVSFEMDCSHKLVLSAEKGSCTMEYESVIGQGRIMILPENEKPEALRLIMEHYGRGGFPISQKIIPSTTVMRLSVEKMTAKHRFVASQG